MKSQAPKEPKTLLSLLPQLITASGFTHDYLAGKMNVNPAVFTSKTIEGKWTRSEIELIISFIDNDEVEERLLSEIMKEAEGDERISVAEFMKEMGKLK